MNQKLAFVHGWAESAWSSSHLAKAFEQASFKIVPPDEADILVTHSVGCYFAADYPDAKLVVLIGLPYWPHKPLALSMFQKLALEVNQHRQGEFGWYAQKLAHNTWSILINPLSLPKFWLNRWRQKLPAASNRRRVVLVRNQQDRFCTPEIMKQPSIKNYDFVELPGLHDDCWLNPEPYVSIVRKYVRQLA